MSEYRAKSVARRIERSTQVRLEWLEKGRKNYAYFKPTKDGLYSLARKLEDDIMKDPNKILPAVRIKLLDKIWVRITPLLIYRPDFWRSVGDKITTGEGMKRGDRK